MNPSKNQNLNKINQIILYSQNYAAHKKMMNQAKPRVDSSSPLRNYNHQKLLNQHTKYTNAVQRLKNQELDQSNKKISQKLIQMSKPVSKGKVIEQNLHSITSRSFWNLRTAKQRQRSKQRRQINLQNKKISERISKSHSKQSFGRQSYYKQKTQTMRNLNVRGQFSQRSQSVLENLVYNDLKINSKDIPFLPQLSGRYKAIKSQRINKQQSRISNQKQQKTNLPLKNLSFEKEFNFRF